ncbi:MAG: amidase [SAR202 cluster bacterium]|nr:amidase [SAR202 cluster bacterium]
MNVSSADQSLAFNPAVKLISMLREKQVSSVELTRLYLDRIEAFDNRLHSYLTVDAENALSLAAKADKRLMSGNLVGPLDGLPISIKDLEITAGLKTTGGSQIFKDRIPKEDSVVVERIKSAGAVILGKTNTPEFGLLGVTYNLLGEHCRNPWNINKTSGGSSGGAASALAAGLCPVSIGGDGGGSIRIPSSFCGVFGLKPTQGRVPKYGGAGLPIAANHLSQTGPISRSVADSALIMQIISGFDARDPSGFIDEITHDTFSPASTGNGLRIGWSSDLGFAAVDSEVLNICQEATTSLKNAGCEIDNADIVLNEPFGPFRTLFSAMAYTAYSQLLENYPDQITDYAANCIENGASVTGADYAAALGYVDQIKSIFNSAFEKFDVIITPTLAVEAFDALGPLETVNEVNGREVDPWWGYFPFTFPINLAGLPASSVPVGFSKNKLPIGLQIIGRPRDEKTVLSVSAALEQISPWADIKPDLS